MVKTWNNKSMKYLPKNGLLTILKNAELYKSRMYRLLFTEALTAGGL